MLFFTAFRKGEVYIGPDNRDCRAKSFQHSKRPLKVIRLEQRTGKIAQVEMEFIVEDCKMGFVTKN
jgi:hypothetical protein